MRWVVSRVGDVISQSEVVSADSAPAAVDRWVELHRQHLLQRELPITVTVVPYVSELRYTVSLAVKEQPQ